jgi:hypothetical protein
MGLLRPKAKLGKNWKWANQQTFASKVIVRHSGELATRLTNKNKLNSNFYGLLAPNDCPKPLFVTQNDQTLSLNLSPFSRKKDVHRGAGPSQVLFVYLQRPPSPVRQSLLHSTEMNISELKIKIGGGDDLSEAELNELLDSLDGLEDELQSTVESHIPAKFLNRITISVES